MAEPKIIRVTNWEKYQASHARNTYVWFKFQNSFFRDGKAIELGTEGSLLFFYLLCECAARRSDTVPFSSKIASTLTGLNPARIDQSITHLVSMGCIEVDAKSNIEDLKTHMKLQTPPREASNDRIEENRIEEKGVSPAETHLPTLAKIWNGNRGRLPEVKGCSKERRRKAEARFAEFPDPDYWKLVVGRIAGSRFCNGANDRGWRADFDFLIKPDTHNRVAEGKYDDKQAQVANIKTAAEILRD